MYVGVRRYRPGLGSPQGVFVVGRRDAATGVAASSALSRSGEPNPHCHTGPTVPVDHVLDILSRLSVDAEPELVATRLCELCAEATGMSGAAIMMMSLDRPQVSIGTTNSVSELIEELQYTLGEGPCVDAYEQGAPVLEPDLAEPLVARWTAFSPVAVKAGVRAIFGFPLSVGDLPIGALNLYRDRPGELTANQHADALLLASVAARAIISIEADAAARFVQCRAPGRHELPVRRPPGGRDGLGTARGQRGRCTRPAPGPCLRRQSRHPGARRRRRRAKVSVRRSGRRSMRRTRGRLSTPRRLRAYDHA